MIVYIVKLVNKENPMTRILISITDAMDTDLKQLAALRGVSVASLLRGFAQNELAAAVGRDPEAYNVRKGRPRKNSPKSK